MMLMRYENNLRIIYNVNEAYNDNQILPFSIQTLIENAIKHNVITTHQPLTIEIFSDNTIKDIYCQLDPQQFYKANRQQIINRSVIKDISTWFGNKVLINLKISVPQKITISKGRAAEFKKWLANN